MEIKVKYLIIPLVLALSVPAHATVSACSKLHSGKCVTGDVKQTRMGEKVRLPGGTWVDCAGDCKDKLRSKTVDFWYEQMNRN